MKVMTMAGSAPRTVRWRDEDVLTSIVKQPFPGPLFVRPRLGRTLEPANFGENVTIEGFDEPGVCIGDTFRVGTAVLEATIPRLPCYKLGIRSGDAAMVKIFTQAGAAVAG